MGDLCADGCVESHPGPTFEVKPREYWTELALATTAEERHEHARRCTCARCGQIQTLRALRDAHRRVRVRFWDEEPLGGENDNFMRIRDEFATFPNVKLIPRIFCAPCWKEEAALARAGSPLPVKLHPLNRAFYRNFRLPRCRMGSNDCGLCKNVKLYREKEQIKDRVAADPEKPKPVRKSLQLTYERRRNKAGAGRPTGVSSSIDVDAALSIAATMKMSGRQLRRLMKELHARADIAVPGQNKLQAALELAGSALDGYFEVAETELCSTHAYVYCTDVVNFMKLIVAASGYTNEQVRLVKLAADEGQSKLQASFRVATSAWHARAQ